MSNVVNHRVTRKHVARNRWVLGSILALLTVVVLLVFVSCGPTAGTSSAGGGTVGAGPGDSTAAFSIEGNATQPISPGVRAALDLKLTNPHDVPMSVTNLRVTVQKVTAPNADVGHPCALGDFAVDQASSSLELTLGARSTSTLSDLGLALAKRPHVGMLDRPANQDGCKGASLTLRYAASGTLAQ